MINSASSISNCWPLSGTSHVYSGKPELQKTVDGSGAKFSVCFDQVFVTKEELIKAIESLTERAKSL